MTVPDKDKKFSESEIAKRRDAGLRALLEMPPKQHKEIIGDSKKKPIRKKARPQGD